ncbi:nudix hydrolase 2-like [Mercurialis annua]|uniref:nudix hydrolase 2-like n=1 Tax=Mercurialis annua TaxID=3986 RepID=UPI00215E8EBD|nr:nudix hydrolase 2-like [Mercurialis annua]
MAGSESVANGVSNGDLLAASADNFGGVTVHLEEQLDPQVFHAKLRASVSAWRQQGKRGVWLKLPIELVNLLENAVKEGFYYHHAESTYIMLVYWIPDTPSTIPANASHRVGVGGIVLNDKREILVVQESTGDFRGTGAWKIPTGAVDEGEDIFTAAKREVKEETGIDTEFKEILAFRQSHKVFFGKSDLFFICMLRPVSFDIQKQESEIEAAQWMPIEEFAAQPFARKHGLFKYIAELGLAKADKDYAGFSPIPMSMVFKNQISHLYANVKDLQHSSSSTDRL